MNPPLSTLTARAVHIPGENIDTDTIIPSREIKGVGKTGLADGLFANWRYLENRRPNPDFALNRPENRDSQILLSGANFGCGSSREQAVWALKEYGFRVIIAESFGEIFYKNCIQNGLLPIRLSKEAIETLARKDTPLTLDLPARKLDGFGFDIAPADKAMLEGGLDATALILKDEDAITAFEEHHFRTQPWLNL